MGGDTGNAEGRVGSSHPREMIDLVWSTGGRREVWGASGLLRGQVSQEATLSLGFCRMKAIARLEAKAFVCQLFRDGKIGAILWRVSAHPPTHPPTARRLKTAPRAGRG